MYSRRLEAVKIIHKNSLNSFYPIIKLTVNFIYITEEKMSEDDRKLIFTNLPVN